MSNAKTCKPHPHFGILWNLSLWNVFPVYCETGCAMRPFKSVQVASWQMPSASARATSQVALASSLHPRGWAQSSSFWAWFARFDSWSPTVHWSWSNLASFKTGCKAMHRWGPRAGPAWCTPCLPEKDTPTLVACWNTSLFPILFLTQEPLALVLVPQIFFSLCFSSFILQLQYLLTFLRCYTLALLWQPLLINSCVCFISLVILCYPQPFILKLL